MTGRPPGRGEVVGKDRERLAASFGQALREQRLAANLTQAKLAKRARMHPDTISRFELGRRRPRVNTIEVLARALAIGNSHWREHIERELLDAALPFLVEDEGGRVARRRKAFRDLEATMRRLDRQLDRQLEVFAAQYEGDAIGDRAKAMLERHRSNLLRSQGDHVDHRRRSEAGSVDSK